MTDIRPFPKTGRRPDTPVEPLLLCPQCKMEMCLLGIEAETDNRDLYTFECSGCGGLEVRGVQVRVQQ
jgi:hypothetical protein